MEKKQTAVQFLLSHIADEGKDMIGRDILEQAIQMERDQIEEAYNVGYRTGIIEEDQTAEQYYTQTFKP